MNVQHDDFSETPWNQLFFYTKTYEGSTVYGSNIEDVASYPTRRPNSEIKTIPWGKLRKQIRKAMER